jgi:hypothetical protein
MTSFDTWDYEYKVFMETGKDRSQQAYEDEYYSDNADVSTCVNDCVNACVDACVHTDDNAED